MNEKQLFGQLREFLNWAGSAFTAWGVVAGNQAAAISGVIISAFMLLCGVTNKRGIGVIFSIMRKFIGAFGAFIVAFDLASEAETANFIALLLPILSHVASLLSNGKVKIDGLPVILTILSLALFLPSCAAEPGAEFRGPITGLKYKDGKALIDQQTGDRWMSNFMRYLAGETPKQIILNPDK